MGVGMGVGGQLSNVGMLPGKWMELIKILEENLLEVAKKTWDWREKVYCPAT